MMGKATFMVVWSYVAFMVLDWYNPDAADGIVDVVVWVLDWCAAGWRGLAMWVVEFGYD